MIKREASSGASEESELDEHFESAAAAKSLEVNRRHSQSRNPHQVAPSPIKFNEVNYRESFVAGIEGSRLGSLINLEQIDPDQEEIWLLSAPSHVSTSELHNLELGFARTKSKCPELTTLGGSKLVEVRVDKNKSKLSLLMPSLDGRLKPVVLSCKGSVSLMEHVIVPSVGGIDEGPLETVPQPEGMRTRHPLLFETERSRGSKRSLDTGWLPEGVVVKEEDTFHSKSKKKKSKKSKR